MKKIFRNLISRDMLKTIAIIAMVIDHIGFYFADKLNDNVYIAFRHVGRIAMPIFVYLLVQGFFYTKSFKKYILRIGIFAIITQALITILMIINKMYYSNYTLAKQVYSTGNILFTFVICLCLMKVLHESILIKKWDYNKNLSLKVVLVAFIYILSMLLPLDYNVEAVILCNLMYFIEKYKIQIFIDKNNNKQNFSTFALRMIKDNTIEIAYIVILFLSLVLVCFALNLYKTMLFAIIPIALYSGKGGKCNNFVKYIYYIIFPLQHVILYMLGMLT